MICYKEIKGTVMNNNRWKNWFKIKSSVRQGCPLSGIIFNYLVELISLKIKQNKEIKGIVINNKCKKASQFADDLWNAIQAELSSFQELIHEYDEFEAFSGLKINYNKTEVLRIGSLRGSNARFYTEKPLHWSDGSIKILGIKISAEMNKIADENYQTALNKVKQIKNVWSARQLSVIGKIQIVNSLLNSQFIYKLQVLPTPKARIMRQYKETIKSFIWNNKKAKIGYDKLISSYENGGVQLRDLMIQDKALKIAKVSDFQTKQTFWRESIKKIIKIKDKQIFQCNMSNKDVQKLPESVFRDILGAWSERNFSNPNNVNEILQQII